MPFITCLFSLIERSISTWHILHKYIFTYHRSWIAMHTLRYCIPLCVSFWQHFYRIPDDHVTGDSTPFTSLRVALLRSVGLTGKSGNNLKFIARILSDFLLLHHKSVSYWIPPTRFDARKDMEPSITSFCSIALLWTQFTLILQAFYIRIPLARSQNPLVVSKNCEYTVME